MLCARTITLRAIRPLCSPMPLAYGELFFGDRTITLRAIRPIRSPMPLAYGEPMFAFHTCVSTSNMALREKLVCLLLAFWARVYAKSRNQIFG